MTKQQRTDLPAAERGPQIVIAGRSYCSNLGLARAFGMAGYRVEVLRIFRENPRQLNPISWMKPDALSKYVTAFHVCRMDRQEQRVLEKLISMADPVRKKLLVTGDDLVANIIDRNLDLLKKYYHVSSVNGRPGELNRLMDKSLQKDLARAAGLPVIGSCVIKTEQGRFRIPESVKYPCFVKPNISKDGQKRGMRKCASASELRDCVTRLSRTRDVELLVEDYIDIKREYSLLGLSTPQGILGPGFFGADQGGHEDRKGYALRGEVLSPEDHQPLVRNILSFVRGLKFEGLFDVDLIEARDGTMYFVELNLRFGGSGYAVTASGVNLPGMYADYILKHKPLPGDAAVAQPGRHFLNERNLLEEYMKGYLTHSQVRSLLKKDMIRFIRSPEDPKPYRHFRKFYPAAFFLRFAYCLKRKLAER